MTTGTPLPTPVMAKGETGWADNGMLLVENWRLLAFSSLAAGVVGLAAAFVVTPTFTARTSFIPPQQQGSGAASALASLGALSSLAGAAMGGIKSPIDQYGALLESTTVADHLIDRFHLLQVYDKKYRFEARRELAKNTRVGIGRKDGLIAIEVDDSDPQRAADIANQYVAELRQMTGMLALTEAQQRRVFFESQLGQARDRLTKAQQALEASGFSESAVKAEPKSAAEAYAKLKAQVTATEVRLQALRRSLSDATPEVQQQEAALSALRQQLGQIESSGAQGTGPDYVAKYREFKYQEALFELYARQYEMARADESRESPLLQVVDSAAPPEKKSKPKRALVAAGSAVAGLLLALVYLFARRGLERARATPEGAARLERMRAAFRRRAQR